MEKLGIRGFKAERFLSAFSYLWVSPSWRKRLLNKLLLRVILLERLQDKSVKISLMMIKKKGENEISDEYAEKVKEA